MLLSKSYIEQVLFASIVLFLFPVLGSAQYPQPQSLGISPSYLYRPGSYTLCAGNGANMTLDIYYQFSGGGGGPIYGWPSLDGGGCAEIYADETTGLGTYYFTAAKNTLNVDWMGMSASVTIDVPPPPSPDFSISMSPVTRALDQGQSAPYSFSFSPANGFYAYLSLSITSTLPSGVSASFSPNPASPDGGSTLTISASPWAPIGPFNFTVQASGGGITHLASGSANIGYQQPSNSMTFNPLSGYAGNQTCYTLTIGNASNLTVDLRYKINSVPQPDTSITMNANGQWPYCPGHYDAAGQYDFTAIKNHQRSDWVVLSPAASYNLWPPKPTSLSISPASVTAGAGTYRMTVGNGALVTLDTKFNINGGATVTVTNWPSLGAVSPGSPNGQADISTSPCAFPGAYNYTQIQNPLNGVWVPVTASETINSPGAPSVTSVTPASGMRGTNVEVTITGANLCGGPASALSTSWSGLTFSNVQSSPNSVTATFAISSTAAAGAATVNLTGGGGTTSLVFTVLAPPPPVTLTKEYIYFGPRVIATEAP